MRIKSTWVIKCNAVKHLAGINESMKKCGVITQISVLLYLCSHQRVVMARGPETGEDDAGAVGTSCSVRGERQADCCDQDRCV